MPIQTSTLFERLQNLASFENGGLARRAYDATMKALRRGLGDDDADWLALDLGPELAKPLQQEVYAGKLSPEELYRWAGRFAGVRRNVAKEQVQSVCRVLGQLLSPRTLARLKNSAPEVAPLFTMPGSDPVPSAK
jgi:uncharacterized protein (DUF2267 family)